MVNIENLKIQNFRTFDSIEIDGLSKINVFVGKNNSGKTTILEALFLLIGMSNPLLPVYVNKFRGLKGDSAQQLVYLFHRMKFENKPKFFATFNDGSKRTLELEAQYQTLTFDHDRDSKFDLVSSITPKLTGLSLDFLIHGENMQPLAAGKSTVTIENNAVKANVANDYCETLCALFVANGKNDMDILSAYSQAFKNNKHAAILKALQDFDGTIQNVFPLDDGIYFDINGLDHLVPSVVMGDGIKRFLDIVVTVSEHQDAFIFVDEIECGLHYHAYDLLWKNLLAFAEKSDVQLFITTHSMEVLAHLKAVLERTDSDAMRELINVFIVANTLKAGYQTYRHSYEGLQGAIECGIELRR